MISKLKKLVTSSFLLFLFNYPISAQQYYPAEFKLTSLNGKNGFAIPGIITDSRAGSDISFIGDINKDGLDDISINAEYAEPNGLEIGGTAYIIFGTNQPLSATFDLNTLNGTNGFIVEGIEEDERRGKMVRGLGDVNGDNIDDIVIGTEQEKHIVLYGSSSGFPSKIIVSDINGSNGFIIEQDGVNEISPAGDMNGDGLNDILVGYPHWEGTSWVIFGSKNFPASINSSWLDGTRGFRISKSTAIRSSFLVGSAGDINDDGYDDIIVGCMALSPYPAKSYVVFGKQGAFPAQVNITSLNGSNGFTIDNYNSGTSIIVWVGTLGDINGDGIDDLFSGNNVVMGSKNTFPATITQGSLNGANGFVFTGFKQTMAPAGDLNLDGIDDFIIVAENGENWIIYGSSSGFSATFDPSDLNGTNGFKIKNLNQSNIGRQVSGKGDFNGDGLSDFMIGSEGTGTGGTVYLIFGGNHYAQPLTTGYPKVKDIDVKELTLQVNAKEKGIVYYGLYHNNIPAISSTDYIKNATDAIKYGSVNITSAAAEFNQVITGLNVNTAYDIYLYFEDEIGNKGEIYKLDNVKTLEDKEAPIFDCPQDITLECGSSLPDFLSSVILTDNSDPNPTISQSPSGGATINFPTTVNITAIDFYGNKATCTVAVKLNQSIECPGNIQLTPGTLLPDYRALVTTYGYCSASPALTQSPDAGTVVTENMLITITANDSEENYVSCSFTVNELVSSVSDSQKETAFIFYPNPSRNSITIKNTAYEKYKIINATGTTLLEGSATETIDISSLQNGMYTFIVYNNNFQVVSQQKLMKY